MTAVIETTNKVDLEEATKGAALVKAVLERAAQGEASWIEAVARRKAARARAAQVVAAIELVSGKFPRPRSSRSRISPGAASPARLVSSLVVLTSYECGPHKLGGLQWTWGNLDCTGHHFFERDPG